MKKILFIIRKTSESAYQDCLESITALKMPAGYIVKNAPYEILDVFSASDAYLDVCQAESPDISIILDDTVLLVYDNLLNEIADIFSADESIGVIGIKGAEKMPVSGIIDDADRVYGGLYEMNFQREVFEKKYAAIEESWVQVEAVSSTFLAVRGYIPIWTGVSSRCLGEIMSLTAAVHGYKAVVPKGAHHWCFSTVPEPVADAEEICFIQRKYQFKNVLFSKKYALLTIGIPTFNRAKFFRKCISNLYRQVGDMPWIEIFVSNNASTDDTEEIAKQYCRYKNFRYYRQPVNIHGKNFDYLYENACGDFVVACGDDDYYTGEAILSLLEAICLYPESTVISLEWPMCYTKPAILHGSGLDDFLVSCTHLYTCISCIVLNHRHYMAIDVKDRFAHTHLNQCYIQLEMLRRSPAFSWVKGNTLLSDSGEAAVGRRFAKNERHPYCDIFIREYYPILDYFLDKGLSREAYEKEKIVNLNKALSWFDAIHLSGEYIQWLIDEDLDALMEEFYGYEPYYEEVKQAIEPFVLKYCND